MFEARGGQAQAQVFARRILDRVRLVKHHGGNLGQKGGAVAAQGQVGKQQMVVRHQQVRILHPGPGAHQETALALGAFRAEAVAMFGADGAPSFGRRRLPQFLHAAVLGLIGPGAQALQFLAQALAKQFPLVAARARQAPQAQVVHAALHQHRPERNLQPVLQAGQILAYQLLLEGDRVGGHQHPGPGAFGLQDQRNEIS